MGKYRYFTIILLSVLFCIPTLISYSQYDLSYDYVMEMAKESLEKGDYRDAKHYFDVAQLMKPESSEPLFYLNLIKRAKEGKVKDLSPKPEKETYHKKLRYKKTYKPSFEIKREQTKAFQKKQDIPRKKKISDFLDFWSKKGEKQEKIYAPEIEETIVDKPKKALVDKEIKREVEDKTTDAKKTKIKKSFLYLDDTLYSSQPKTELEIIYGQELVIEGAGISAFIATNTEILDIKRISSSQIKLSTKRMGSTFMHLWQGKKRWTFKVNVLPEVVYSQIKRRQTVFTSEPFEFIYNNSWSSYYNGEDFDSLERGSISFSQWLGIQGQSPYGWLDASMRVAKYGSTYEVTNYTAGLTNGDIYDFKGFNIRIFDISKSFSRLSFPGQYIRGAYLESYAFDKKIHYTALWGKERGSSYSEISPGIIEERSAYIEGLRLRFFPDTATEYALNCAHGYGGGRDAYLKDRAYSVEVKHRREDFNLATELATNEEAFAGTANFDFNGKDSKLEIDLRNIERDFTTISGRPGSRGELGAHIGYNKKISDKTRFNADLDVHRNRYLYNPNKERKPNINFNASLNKKLTDVSSISWGLNYINEPGLQFAQRFYSIDSNYSRLYKIFERNFYTFANLGFRKSRNLQSPSSDYDAYRLGLGVRSSLSKQISWYLNYTQNWVEEMLSREDYNPFVWETGVSTSKRFGDKISSTFSLYYRNEEDTQGTYSFLSGEDSIGGQLTFNYAPIEGVKMYVSGSLDRMYPEDSSDKSTTGSIRFGLRSNWDLPFSWDPKGVVEGVVFKDANGNSKKDLNEKPVKDVEITIGDKKVKTDRDGKFHVVIRAKKVLVEINPDTIPEGNVLTTPYSFEVEIKPTKKQVLDIGVSSSASIYGIVFFDVDNNGKFDKKDDAINGVRIKLGDQIRESTNDGRFYFRGLDKGNYTVLIDVNSVPLEYLPAIPIKKEIELNEGVNYLYYIPLRRK